MISASELLVDGGLRGFGGSCLVTHITASSGSRKQAVEVGGDVLRCFSLTSLIKAQAIIMQGCCLLCLKFLAVVVKVMQIDSTGHVL